MTVDPSKNSPLADYFVVCGLDSSYGLETEASLSENAQENRPPLERPYKCRILAHYPQKVSWNPFDDKAVCMLCMPNSLAFKTNKRVSQPKYHTFIITREDGSRCYGHTLTFYEEVKDSGICEALSTLQAMHNAEMSSSPTPRAPLSQKQSYSNSLPRHLKLDSTKMALVEIGLENNKNEYDPSKDRIFVNKCVCFISSTPQVSAFRILLSSLYERTLASPPHTLPIESYVFNALYEVSLPPPGQSSRFFLYPESFFVLQTPGDLELPSLEYSLRVFFRQFGVEAAVDLVSCALLEHQILLCSNDLYMLMLVAECITSLMFPFSWQHVYAPILPSSMQNFLDAPVPFIMGLCRKGRSLQIDLPRTEGNICFVDIDGQKIRFPEELPLFPDRQEFASELKDVIRCYGAILNADFIRHRIQHKESRGLTRKFSLTDMTEAESFREFRPASRSDIGTKKAQNRTHSQEPAKKQEDQFSLSKALSPVKRAIQKSRGHGDASASQELFSYVDEMRFNNAVREVCLNRFVQIFHSYEHYLIPTGNEDHRRDSSYDGSYTFDKATFLSDQPDTHVPFLSAFLETQMFTSFIDEKVLILTGSLDKRLSPSVKIFEHRILRVREAMGESLVRAVTYQPCSTIEKTEQILIQRLKRSDSACPKPSKPVKKVIEQPVVGFPLLDEEVMNPTNIPPRRVIINTKKRKEVVEGFTNARSTPGRKQSLLDAAPSVIATENWDFVDKLLKECKLRTKKMLVEKLSKEAVELGQNEGYITGVEENTHIASLCDLLERVWSHGLHIKQGKSSLWSHLSYYQQRHEKPSTDNKASLSSGSSVPSTAYSWEVLRKRLEFSPEVSPRSRTGLFASLSQTNMQRLNRFLASRAENNGENLANINMDVQSSPGMEPSRPGNPPADDPSASLLFDMKNVLAMPEIKSALGYARAWVRLSLEKKLLARHLKVLLADGQLLQTLYRRYAFLRNEDEREQFLCHLLSLNAVDFYCFTNTFVSTLIPYRIIITANRKFLSSTPENFWFCLGGTLADSGNIVMPRNTTQIVFQRKNLGLLTTLRIGLDPKLMNSKWLIDFVTIRNEVTGQLAKFPCGRWLGRNVDDGSIERILVTEFSGPSSIQLEMASPAVVSYSGAGDSATLPRTPQRCRSPSASRRSTDSRFDVGDIQRMLGDAANALVKFLCKPDKEKGRLTSLLCGEMGLIFGIEQALLYGYAPSRFSRQPFVWTLFEKCEHFYRTELLGEKRMSSQRRQVVQRFRHLVLQIDKTLSSMGKDGKLQLFVALSIRDHCMDVWLELVSSCPIVDTAYERDSFLRNPLLLKFLLDIVRSLNGFQITLEPSLTRGLESFSCQV